MESVKDLIVDVNSTEVSIALMENRRLIELNKESSKGHGFSVGDVYPEMIIRGEFGYMAGIRNNQIVSVPLDEVAGKLKTVNPDNPIIKEAKLIGICFGDEPIKKN